MALSLSVDKVDETGRELLTYGTDDFPVAFFDDDMVNVIVPFHWHEEFEIVVITDGSVHVRIAGNDFKLKAGEGYFANSGILHSANLESASGHQHALVFSASLISRKGDLIWNSYITPVLANPRIPFIRLDPTIPWHQDILTLSETAWLYGAYERKDYPLRVRDSLSQVFALITGHRAFLENESGDMDQYQRDEMRVKKSLVFIENHYDSAITIDQIARGAGISVSTCLRLFRVVMNITPIQYLLKYRLQKAKEALIQDNGRKISEIAYACGFSDASYFNRCFLREYGRTPSEHRKLHTS